MVRPWRIRWGRRKLVELRERAEAELGEDFDIRQFHEALLEHGSLPLVVLGPTSDRVSGGSDGGGRTLIHDGEVCDT